MFPTRFDEKSSLAVLQLFRPRRHKRIEGSHEETNRQVEPGQDQIAHHCDNLIPLADMLCILLAQPDGETAIDGMHKV